MDVDTWGHIHFVCGGITSLEAKSSAVHGSSGAASGDDEDADDAIIIHGFAVTKISSIGPSYLGSEEELEEIFTSWQRLGVNTSCAHPDGSPCQPGDEILADGSLRYYTGETVREAFRKTTAVAVYLRRTSRDSGGSSKSEDIDPSAILQYEAEYKASHARAFKDATENRRFFVTQDDVFMGLGPSEAKVDDVVAILHGGHVATILRKLEGEDGETTDKYVVVGEAYVHGLMSGEAFDDAFRTGLNETLREELVTRDSVLA